MAIIHSSLQPNVPEIALQTRRAHHIENDRSFEVTRWDAIQDADIRNRRPSVRFRTNMSPIYNCHGLTFGSRRTRIYPDGVRQILSEDDYVPIPVSEVMPGDVIVYFSPEDGDVEHSGVVCDVRTVVGANAPAPWICSKWGPGSEAYHHWSDCPYSPLDVKYYRVKK